MRWASKGRREGERRIYRIYSVFVELLTGSGAACRRGVHPGILQDLDQFATKGADVLLDLVHVVLGHPLALRLPLLNRHVPPHQISHDALISEVPLGRLLNLPLSDRIKD